MGEYTISKKHLELLIKECSETLVGEVCKRFELLDDKNTIKKVVKELIYENLRHLKKLIQTFSSGMKFISKPRDNLL